MGRPVGCASSLALDSARGMGSHEGKTVLRRWRKVSALPTILQSASRRADFSGLPGSLLLRPVKLLAPSADLTRVPPAIGTFTSRLPTSRSPFSPLGITTTVTGLLCRKDAHPLESQLALLRHPSRREANAL
jgi:hypothetical protein